MTFRQKLGAVVLLFTLLGLAVIAKAGNTRVLNANTVNMESSSNAANVVALTVPSSVTPYTFKLPGAVGSSGQALYATDGSGTLGWLSVFTNPMTTTGDMIYSSSGSTPARLGAGTSVQLLHSGTPPTWSAVSLTADVSGTLPVARGGTSLTAGTSGGILGYTATGTLASSGALTASQLIIGGGAGATPSTLAAGSQYQVLTMGASNPGYGAVNLAQSAAVTGALPIGNGGTGQATKAAAFDALSPMTTAGDLIYGGTAGTGTRLGVGSATQVLHGGASAPAYSAVSLTADVSGILPVANGGTALASGTSGGVLAYTASGTLASSGALTANAVVVGGGAGAVPTVVTNNSTGTNKLLTQSSSGTPAWATLVAGDIPNLPASIITSGQLAVANGGTAVSSVTTSPTASSFAGWDAQRNLSADNFVEGYTTTATAAGTTTLTVDSTYHQYFTGATTQTVTLPVTSTMVLGQAFQVVNNSSGVVTVQSSGGNTVQAMAAASVATFTVILTSGTSAASWNVTYQTATAATVSSVAMTVPAFLSVAGSPVTSSGTLAVSLSGTALPVANGGTGATTLAVNGVLYGNTTSAVQALAVNSTATNKFLTQSSSAAPAWATIAAADVPVSTTSANGGITLKSPTQQAFTSSTGTWTKPAGVLWIRVRMVGGGGGGGGGSNGGSGNGGTGGTGGTTTFGSSFLTANGGVGGGASTTGPGGNGGAASLAAGAVGIAMTGSGGGGGVGATGSFVSGAGGSSPFGGAGKGVAGNTEQDAANNSGSGGSGSGTNGSGVCQPGGGGGAGGFLDVIIEAPASSYATSIGAGGTAGAAGTGSSTGGVGGSGYILVEEHYY